MERGVLLSLNLRLEFRTTGEGEGSTESLIGNRFNERHSGGSDFSSSSLPEKLMFQTQQPAIETEKFCYFSPT